MKEPIGILVMDKEADFTSFDVIAKLRGILHMRKIGHTGTLDPQATGVLPVCVGRATKVCNLLTDMDKTYEAQLLLGKITDTQDIWGEVLEEREVSVTKEELLAVIQKHIGWQEQIPPMYSAKKIGGKKLYELAREGKEVERKASRICVHSIELLSFEPPKARLRVHCSKGTYIRTLLHDMGQELGCGGCMSYLRRTQVGPFTLEDAHTLSFVQQQEDPGALLIPVDRLFPEDVHFTVKESAMKQLLNGNILRLTDGDFDGTCPETGKQVLVYDSAGEFKAIYERKQEHLKIKAMF
ncbi:MAG: tRNA pseudouridine(55) synthase TruB [Lachnospiraceae bacterium]|nr:tRNA pseudouridine(55) synthase TruB [Lachnospiraceae bacterium]